LVIITGIGAPGTGKWIHVKLLLVLVMAGAHGLMAKYRKDFENGNRPRSDKFSRILSLVLTVLLILIIILAVFKPF
jgi:putative membrane protein